MKPLKLKNDTITYNRKLDRVPSFDVRSRDFPVTAKISSQKPVSKTWECNVWLDQGAEGACTGFGVCHELAAEPFAVKGLTAEYARERIYWNAQKLDQWPGGAYPGASPRYEGTSVIVAVKVAMALGWFEEYSWAFGLHDLILGVGHNGPAIMGLDWYQGMYQPDEDGYIKPTGQQTGGHCILCLGVDINKRHFILHNSWGKDWGMDGRCYITFTDMEKLLKEGGEAVFVKGRKLCPDTGVKITMEQEPLYDGGRDTVIFKVSITKVWAAIKNFFKGRN